MTRRRRWAAAALMVATLIVSGCGEEANPIRIAVLADCAGPFGFAYEASVAGSELPLIDRGAKLVAKSPSAGVRDIQVASRSVELMAVCLTGLSSVDAQAVRRAVEADAADVVIGPTQGAAGIIYRSYAKRQPTVTFVSGTAAAPSMTAQEPAANLFRFTPDGSQWSAGLGAYAYRELGWRKAAVVNEDYSFGWEQAAGFVAEFCSLGGTVVRASPRLGTTDLAPTVTRLTRAHVDGVYLASSAAWLPTLANEVPELKGALAGKLVAGIVTLGDNAVLTLGKRLDGVVYGASLTYNQPRPPGSVFARYSSRFNGAFPTLPPGSGDYLFAIGYYNAMEAVVEALEQVDGDLSDGQRLFQAALARVSLDAPNGRIRLDANRQAIAPNYLIRVNRVTKNLIQFAPFRTIPNVDASFGGLFPPGSPPPGPNQPACKKGNPPPWAR